jgi:gamma-glutamyltranspeptidase/glutathione hydrolase
MSLLGRILFAALLLPVGVAAATLPKQAVVASANAQATDAGLEVLAAGGNAFDAAVAVSATLGLVEPESSGLGGGGFFLLHLAGQERQVFVDARERAPLAASRDMYLDSEGNANRELAVDGALAAGIPGLPAALVHLAHSYGRLPLAQSLAPSIRLAREGWVFGRKNATMMGWRKPALLRNPAAAALFLQDGNIPAQGSRMLNPDYAVTLERLAQQGHDGFYRGELAQRMVDGVAALGGIWSLGDLAEYRVIERAPLSVQHRGYRIITAPPPSSGGIALAQTLHILEGLPYAGAEPVQKLHWLTEALRRAYRDRAIYLGDPDFVSVPVEMLMSPHYAAGLRASIHPLKATPSALLPGVGDSGQRPDTSHFSIIDREGNLAAVTQTVNLPYGNAVVVPGTGFLLNNEMDDFSVKAGVPNAFGLIGDDANAIEPGKRPLSSMTPSLLFGPRSVAVLGTPGGSRIISMVLIGLLSLMDGASAQEAAATPRVHHQSLPDVLAYEKGSLDAATIEALRERGFRVESARESWGNMQVARWDIATGKVDAGSDPRWGDVGKASTAVADDADSIYR